MCWWDWWYRKQGHTPQHPPDPRQGWDSAVLWCVQTNHNFFSNIGQIPSHLKSVTLAATSPMVRSRSTWTGNSRICHWYKLIPALSISISLFFNPSKKNFLFDHFHFHPIQNCAFSTIIINHLITPSLECLQLRLATQHIVHLETFRNEMIFKMIFSKSFCKWY